MPPGFGRGDFSYPKTEKEPKMKTIIWYAYGTAVAVGCVAGGAAWVRIVARLVGG